MLTRYGGDADYATTGLAYAEMAIAIARVLYLYDMQLAIDQNSKHCEPQYAQHAEWEFQLRDTFTSTKDGPMVDFRQSAVSTTG